MTFNFITDFLSRKDIVQQEKQFNMTIIKEIYKTFYNSTMNSEAFSAVEREIMELNAIRLFEQNRHIKKVKFELSRAQLITKEIREQIDKAKNNLSKLPESKRKAQENRVKKYQDELYESLAKESQYEFEFSRESELNTLKKKLKEMIGILDRIKDAINMPHNSFKDFKDFGNFLRGDQSSNKDDECSVPYSNSTTSEIVGQAILNTPSREQSSTPASNGREITFGNVSPFQQVEENMITNTLQSIPILPLPLNNTKIINGIEVITTSMPAFGGNPTEPSPTISNKQSPISAKKQNCVSLKLLKQKRPAYFYSHLNFMDISVFNATFSNGSIDIEFLTKVLSLKSKNEIEFREACSLLSLIYEKFSLEERGKRDFLAGKDEEEKSEEELNFRNSIIMRCVEEFFV